MAPSGPADRTNAAAIAPSLLRTMNQRYLLDWLYANGAATRPRLARDSGLSQPTVFATLANLEKAGLVRPVGQSDETSGRPALVYEADPTAGHVLAIHLGHDWIRVGVSDLVGTRLSSGRVRNTARSVASLVSIVHAAAATACGESELDLADISCATIGSPGVHASRISNVGSVNHLPGWQRPKLQEALNERFGIPLTFENDVNLAALAEYSEGAAQGVDPFVYAHIGTGLGIGLVINGQIYRGATGAAGEIGYLPVDDASRGAGKDGILQEALAAEAVVDYAREAGMTGLLTATKVFAEARAGSDAALTAVSRQSDNLARLLVSISAFLDPELIVVGGGIGQNLDLLSVGIADRFAALGPMRPRVAVSALGAEATVRGAIVYGLAAAREQEFTARLAGADSVQRATHEAVSAQN